MRSHLIFIIGLFVITILVGLPLLQGKLIGGHDSILYPPRFIEFVIGLKSHQWYPRWAADLSSGYGQPFFIYNPPLLYYLEAIFIISGIGLFNSINITLLTIIFFSALGMYLLASDILDSKAGFIAATAYIFSPYFLVNLYVRAAWSDFTSFSCIPFLFWGVYRYANEERIRFLLISTLAMTLLMLSSNHISLITIPFTLVFITCNAYSRRSWQALWRGFTPIIFGLGLSAFFWLPAFVDRKYVHLEREIGSIFFNYKKQFVYPHQLFSSYWGYGGSVPGPNDKMSFSIGLVHMVMVIILIPFLSKIWKSSKSAGLWLSFMLFVVLGSIFFTTSISQPIWNLVSILQSLQFPWRFLATASVASSFIVGFPFVLLHRKKNVHSNILMTSLFLIIVVLGMPNTHPPMYHDNEPFWQVKNIVRYNLRVNILDMFEPIWVKKKPSSPVSTQIKIINGEGNVIATRLSPTHLQADVELQTPSKFRAKIHYFPGWMLYVDDVKHKIRFDNSYGTIEFYLNPGKHHIDLVFINTPLRLWSERLSLFSLILLIMIIIWSPLSLMHHR